MELKLPLNQVLGREGGMGQLLEELRLLLKAFAHILDGFDQVRPGSFLAVLVVPALLQLLLELDDDDIGQLLDLQRKLFKAVIKAHVLAFKIGNLLVMPIQQGTRGVQRFLVAGHLLFKLDDRGVDIRHLIEFLVDFSGIAFNMFQNDLAAGCGLVLLLQKIPEALGQQVEFIRLALDGLIKSLQFRLHGYPLGSQGSKLVLHLFNFLVATGQGALLRLKLTLVPLLQLDLALTQHDV